MRDVPQKTLDLGTSEGMGETKNREPRGDSKFDAQSLSMLHNVDS
jgi:hypothetical protein